MSNTTIQNLDQLPTKCFGVEAFTGNLILIWKGKQGFTAIDQLTPQNECIIDNISMGELADTMNKENGITIAQRSAMEWGSLCDWEIPLANVSNYNENGFFSPESQQQ